MLKGFRFIKAILMNKFIESKIFHLVKELISIVDNERFSQTLEIDQKGKCMSKSHQYHER